MIEFVGNVVALLLWAPFWLFGLWWLLFPRQVVRFYVWFHGLHGVPSDVMERRMGAPFTIRMGGAAVLALMIWCAWKYGPPRIG